jgi:hypothetical protein
MGAVMTVDPHRVRQNLAGACQAASAAFAAVLSWRARRVPGHGTASA